MDYSFKLLCIVLFLICLAFTELTAEYCTPLPESEACPRGWDVTENPRTCLNHTFLKLRYNDSRKFCQKAYADLVVADTRQAWNVVSYYLWRKTFLRFWIGLNDLDRANRWVWTDGQTLGNYKRWHQGYPNTDGNDCVSMATDTNNWKNGACSNKLYFVCELTLDPAHSCPDQWSKINLRPTQAIHQCLRLFRVNVTWHEAKKRCSDNFARLLKIEHQKKFQEIHRFYQGKHAAWLGLTDNQDEGKFIWIGGGEVTTTSWGNAEPSGGRGENCVATKPEGKWLDTQCTASNSIMCQKVSRLGPKAVKMNIDYHRPPDTLFDGQSFTATCTAEGTETGNITWSTFDSNNRGLNLQATIITENAKRKKYGLCLNRTTSVYRVTVDQTMNGAVLSCFAYKTTLKKCERPQMRMAFCGASKKIKVVDGPKRPPVLSIAYEGQPDPIQAGSKIKMTCKVFTGKEGTLQWVLYSKSGPRLLNHTRDKRVTAYSVSTHPQLGRYVESVLQIPMSYGLSGISVACFAYDAKTYRKDLKCRRADVYCEKTNSIEVASGLSVWMWILIVTLVLLTVLGFLAYPLKNLLLEDEGEDSESISSTGQMTENVKEFLTRIRLAAEQVGDNTGFSSYLKRTDETRKL